MWIENPILKKDLIASLRRPKAFAIVTIWILATGLVLAWVWPRNTMLATAARQGSFLFQVFFMTQLILVATFSAAFAAPAFAGEKENQSDEMFATTLLPPRAVVAGKFLASVGHLMILLVGGMPVAAAGFLLGGLEMQTLAASYLVLFACLCFCTAVSLACSIRSSRAHVALAWSYGVIGVLSLALWLTGLMPLIAATRVDYVGRRGIPRVLWSATASVGGAPAGVAVAPFLLLLSIMVLVMLVRPLVARPAEPRRFKRQKLIADPVKLRERRRTFPFYLIDPLRKQELIDDRRNPIFVKEMRSELFTKGSTMARLLYGSLCFYMVLLVPLLGATAYRSLYAAGAWMTLPVLLLAPGLAARSLSREIEQGNIDALRSTLMRPRQILFGKILATLAATSPMLIGFVAMHVLLACQGIDRKAFEQSAVNIATVVVSMIAANACGVFSSVCSRRTAGSVVRAYVLVAFLFGAYVVPQALFPSSPATCVLSPIGALLLLHNPSRLLYSYYGLRGASQVHLIRYWAASMGVSLLCASILYGLASWLFSRQMRGKRQRMGGPREACSAVPTRTGLPRSTSRPIIVTP